MKHFLDYLNKQRAAKIHATGCNYEGTRYSEPKKEGKEEVEGAEGQERK